MPANCVIAKPHKCVTQFDYVNLWYLCFVVVAVVFSGTVKSTTKFGWTDGARAASQHQQQQPSFIDRDFIYVWGEFAWQSVFLDVNRQLDPLWVVTVVIDNLVCIFIRRNSKKTSQNTEIRKFPCRHRRLKQLQRIVLNWLNWIVFGWQSKHERRRKKGKKHKTKEVRVLRHFTCSR